MSRFTVTSLAIEGVKLVKRTSIVDERGSFTRLFCSDQLLCAGWKKPIAQINLSRTLKRGSVRGLHYQEFPSQEMKLVTCTQGEIFDVAVDIRRGSDTFLKHQTAYLSADNGLALLIPEGVAHGFQALTDNVEIIYLHSSAYDPVANRGLNPMDPGLAINWPLELANLSEQDELRPFVNESFIGVQL